MTAVTLPMGAKPRSEAFKVGADVAAVGKAAANKAPVVTSVGILVLLVVLGWHAIDRWGAPSVSVDAPDRYTATQARHDWDEQLKINAALRDVDARLTASIASLVEGQERIEKRLDVLDERQQRVMQSLARLEGQLRAPTAPAGMDGDR